jgi:exodeoxyribonuclease VIII
VTFTIEFEETPKSRRKKLAADLTTAPPQEIVSKPMHETTTPLGSIRYGLPYEDYDAINAWRPSVIVEMAKSPFAVHWARWGNGLKKETESLIWGQAVHIAAFEALEFDLRVEAADGKRTSKAKAEAKERGTILLKPGAVKFGHDSAVQAASRLFDYAPLRPFLECGGQRELSLFTEECGLPCKCRVDYLSSRGEILDLKTSRDISERRFSSDFYRYHYDVKLGLYQRWTRRLFDLPEVPVYLLLVENQPPHDVTMVPRVNGTPIGIPQPVLERGADKGLRWLEQIAGCIKEDCWPGIDVEPDWTLQTPTWEMDDEELQEFEG